MKKTLRYLLIVMGMMSVLSLSAQALAQKPEVQMKSTSIMAGSGSTLPQAAVDGTTTTYGEQGSIHKGGIKKAGGGQTGGGPSDRPDPYKDPLGDVLWPLMLLALVYALLRVYMRASLKYKEQKH